VSDQSASVDEASLDILRFEPGITFEDGFGTIAGGEHSEDMFHGQPMSPNNRLPAENPWVDSNPLEELIFL
jgi:hypothetical protein